MRVMIDMPHQCATPATMAALMEARLNESGPHQPSEDCFGLALPELLLTDLRPAFIHVLDRSH